MNYLYATIYGVIQGLTEFLPVSSSGHLALLPYILKFKDPGVLFDLAMHMGTALSVGIYFRKNLWVLFAEALALISRNKTVFNQRHYLINFTVATLCTTLLALFLKDWAPVWGRRPSIMAFNLAFFGILMFLADSCFKKNESCKMSDKIEWRKSLWIGFFQGLALFPGVSRSGATLTISRFLGLSRVEATSFSFLLSLPLIVGGFFLKLIKLSQLPAATAYNSEWNFALWGMFISFIVGLLTIHFFLKFINKIGLWSFSLYRLLLAIIIISF